MTVFIIIAIGISRPFVSLFNNRLELFNEFMIQLCFMSLYIYTEWIPDT